MNSLVEAFLTAVTTYVSSSTRIVETDKNNEKHHKRVQGPTVRRSNALHLQ